MCELEIVRKRSKPLSPAAYCRSNIRRVAGPDRRSCALSVLAKRYRSAGVYFVLKRSPRPTAGFNRPSLSAREISRVVCAREKPLMCLIYCLTMPLSFLLKEKYLNRLIVPSTHAYFSSRDTPLNSRLAVDFRNRPISFSVLIPESSIVIVMLPDYHDLAPAFYALFFRLISHWTILPLEFFHKSAILLGTAFMAE